MRKQSGFEQVLVRIGQCLLADAVVARLVVLQPASYNLIAERVKKIVVKVMPGAEQRAGFGHQLAVCGLVGGSHGQSGFALADHIDDVYRSLSRSGEFDFAEVRSGYER